MTRDSTNRSNKVMPATKLTAFEVLTRAARNLTGCRLWASQWAGRRRVLMRKANVPQRTHERFRLLPHELLIELRIMPAARPQFFVCALLNDLPLAEHQDPMGVAHGGKPVSNDEAGAAGKQVFQRRPK